MRRYVISCDRCNSEIRNAIGATKVESDRPVNIGIHPTKHFDFCDACGDSFEAFVQNKPVRCAGPMSSNM